MFSRSLQLVCSILVLFIFQSVSAQSMSTATENGIISAAGAPEPTQSISYLIEGESPTTITTTSKLPLPTHSSGSDVSPISGENSNLTNSNEQGLTIPAILGITVAVVLAVVAIIIAVIIIHKKRGQTVARAKRKSIMDMEFAGESKANLAQIETNTLHKVETNQSANATIGYFDVAKPLPAVVKDVDTDRLSRSSTIIGDAAEIAQINRKASSHQKRQKAARDAVRERNHALQILITNEDNRTSVVPNSPFTSNPSTPVDANPNPQGDCTDGNGDMFVKRPSKI